MAADVTLISGVGNGDSARVDLELLTVEDVAVLFKVKRGWIYDQVEAGALPAVRLPGSRLLRFRRCDLDAYLASATG